MAPISKSSVMVFEMAGCPACQDYVPRFKRLARGYPGMPIVVHDVDKQAKLSGSLKVRATPTTFLIHTSGDVRKIEGAVDDATIKALLDAAYRVR